MAKEIKFTTQGTAIDLTDPSVNPEAAPTATPRQGGFVLRNRIDAAKLSTANRVLCTFDATPATTPTVAMRILEVPERVYVKELMVFAVKDQDVPTIDITGAQSSNLDIKDSDFSLMTLSFGAQRNKRPTSHASYVAASSLVDLTTVNAEQAPGIGTVAGDVFGNFQLNGELTDPLSPVTASNPNILFVDAFQTVDAAIGNPLEPMGTAKKVRNHVGATFVADSAATTELIQQEDGEYFPYGGYVKMQLGPWNTSMASGYSDVTGIFSSPSAATIHIAGVWEIQAVCQYVPE
jgi:hypothetical protein